MTTGDGITKAKVAREACPMRRRSATRAIVLDTIAAVGVLLDDYYDSRDEVGRDYDETKRRREEEERREEWWKRSIRAKKCSNHEESACMH